MVGALPGTPAHVVATLERGGVKVRPLEPADARLELRAGKVAVVLVPPERPGGPLQYRFDAARA